MVTYFIMNLPSTYWTRKQLFPTPVSPSAIIFNSISYVLEFDSFTDTRANSSSRFEIVDINSELTKKLCHYKMNGTNKKCMNGGIWSANARTLSTEYEPLSDFIVPERAGSLYKLFLLFSECVYVCVSVYRQARCSTLFVSAYWKKKKRKQT